MTLIAGYDVGGAHLKVALVRDGRLVHAEQIACPLWRGVAELDAALADARKITGDATRHAVTMTGELADVFPDRYTGVAMIVERLEQAFGASTVFFAGQRGLIGGAEAVRHYEAVASANFLATASVAAAHASDGVLIDMGSTTTDIVPFAEGIATPRGLTDAERLRTGELVYTGLTRTPVMAVTTRGLFQGHWQGLARDPFATMADVRRVLGDLPEGVDQHATADGRGKSVEECRARLARCFGRDAEPGEDRDWEIAARHIAEEQLASIRDGLLQAARLQPGATAVTAGIGAQVAAIAAQRLGLTAITFGRLVSAPDQWHDWATACAPAVSVALLAGRL